MACLECGGRNPDAARRCWRCSTGLEDRATEKPVPAGRWEYTELEVPLPRLRWYQLPATWLPSIERQLERVEPHGWHAAHEVDVPALATVGRFRRGDQVAERAAEADRVVLTVRRRSGSHETVHTSGWH